MHTYLDTYHIFSARVQLIRYNCSPASLEKRKIRQKLDKLNAINERMKRNNSRVQSSTVWKESRANRLIKVYGHLFEMIEKKDSQQELCFMRMTNNQLTALLGH